MTEDMLGVDGKAFSSWWRYVGEWPLTARANRKGSESGYRNRDHARSWLFSLIVLSVCEGGWGVLYNGTLADIVRGWFRTDTYTHGIIVVPVSAYLVWRRKELLYSLSPAVWWWGAFVLCAVSLAWWTAKLAGVQVAEQTFVVAMVPVVVATILGKEVFRRSLFPLFYLFFAIPVGDILVPLLMDFTANFTVAALHISRIPVYQEGHYILLPSAQFEVARVCSGLRFLIAAVALGTLYAYVAYRSVWRRVAFVALISVLAIVGNGVRAFGIVLIGHYISLQAASGTDHILYGWLFFGVLVAVALWLGRFLREPAPLDKAEVLTPRHQEPEFSMGSLFVAPLALAALAAGPIINESAVRSARLIERIAGLPTLKSDWVGPRLADADWAPAYRGATVKLQGRYARDDQTVNLHVYQYTSQMQGQELINSQNRIVDESQWKRISGRWRVVPLPDGSELRLTETEVRSGSESLVIWHWFNIAGYETSVPVLAKLREAGEALRGERNRSYLVAIGSRFKAHPAEAREALQSYLGAVHESLARCLLSNGGRSEDEGAGSEPCEQRILRAPKP